MLGRVFFFSMLINTCQQCCLQKRFIQTSIPLGSNHDQHRRQTSTSPSLLTAQGGEQPLADAPSSLSLRMGHDCSLIPSMEKVETQTWKNAGAKLEELCHCVSELTHGFLSSLNMKFLRFSAPFS